MKGTEFGTRIVNSCFTLSLMVGVSVADTTLGTAIANLGWDEVRFPKPVFPGDTLRCETAVHDMRASRSRPGAGIVIFEHRAFNQRDEQVAALQAHGADEAQGGGLMRSMLFVPGDRPERFAKAASQRRRRVILDLEDSVVPGQRPSARRRLRGLPWLGGSAGCRCGCA